MACSTENMACLTENMACSTEDMACSTENMACLTEKMACSTENMEEEEETEVTHFMPKLCLRRWVVLASYCLLSVSNLSCWFAFSAISNILQSYYQINLVRVNWLAMVFSIVSIILMFPSHHLLEKKGLAIIMVLAGFFNAVGCCIRYAGYSVPGIGYYFLLAGSIVSGISTSAFLFLPSTIAAVWFGEKERATATSIAIAADSLGMALSYILPTYTVRNSLNVANIGTDLGTFLLFSAIQSFATFVFICISVQDKPPTPPSYSELQKNETFGVSEGSDWPLFAVTEDVGTTVFPQTAQSPGGFLGYKLLFKNIHFHTVLNLHGMLFGIESVFLIALNEILIEKYPGYEGPIGWMGAIGLILSIPTNFLVGILLDKTQAFKVITLATTGSCCLLTALLTVFFYLNATFYVLFVAYLFIVATFSTYYTTAFDHCAELTFPISEAQSGVVLLWVAQVYSLLFEQAASWVLLYFGPHELLLGILSLYTIIFVLSFFVKDKGSRPSLMTN